MQNAEGSGTQRNIPGVLNFGGICSAGKSSGLEMCRQMEGGGGL